MSKRVALSVTYLLSDLGGGTGHHLFSLLENRPRGAWEADILSEVANTSRWSPPVPIRVLESPRYVHYPFLQFSRLRALRRHLHDRPPDILHTYFFWSILYGRLLKANGVVPRLVENREDLAFGWGRHEYALLRLTRKLPDRVICVSDAVRDAVLLKEGLPPGNTVVIRNGVAPVLEDTRSKDLRALRAELGIAAGAPIVGMVANFNRPVKGAQYYVDGLAVVARRIPDVRFLLIGLGENQEQLRSRAEEAGVGSNLIITGFRDDIPRFYDLMDVSVLTSLSEGLSITLLESMRHGVPVVATDVGGNPEVVRSGETGFLVPPRDPEAFAERVIQLLEAPDLRKQFGNRAQQIIKRKFNLSTVAAAYGKVYASLIDEGPDA